MQFDSLPDSALIRQRDLIQNVLPFSSATLWRRVKAGTFPQPLKLSAGVTAWRVSEIRQWLNAQGQEVAA